MPWWLWMLLGFALLAVEIFTPGLFYFFFFGAGAILVGGLVGIGVEASVALQWLLFSVFSVAALLFFRRKLVTFLDRKTTNGQTGDLNSIVGDIVTLTDDLAPNAVGKAEGRGSSWTVINGGVLPLMKGQRCRVYQMEGLTLWIRAM
jgi:membrane protein implicated in regulation of membrane protease activity